MHCHERLLLPTAVCCRQHNAPHGVCGPKKLPLFRLLCCAAMDLVDFNSLDKGDFIGVETRVLAQLQFMSVSVCGSLGYNCSLWLPRDSTSLTRSGSYNRRRWDDDLKNTEGSAITNRTPSYQRRLASAATRTSAKLSSLI